MKWSAVLGPRSVTHIDSFLHVLAYSLVMKWCSAPFRRGVHKLKRGSFGEYDNMTPRAAIVDPAGGLALCMYLTKPGTRGEGSYQEIHLLKLLSPPEDIAKVFCDRPVCFAQIPAVHTLSLRSCSVHFCHSLFHFLSSPGTIHEACARSLAHL